MNKEELEDLLSIGCCKYHEEIGEKAKKEIERLNKQVNEALIVCNDRQKEIQRLNNIINEIKDMTLEKRDYYYRVLKRYVLKDKGMCDYTSGEISILEMYLNKLEDLGALKGSDKE